jgi:hypothetical protein
MHPGFENCSHSTIQRPNYWTELGPKVFRVLFSSLLFTVTSPFEQKWFETGFQCKHCIRKPQVWELSRFCSETSTKLYVYEFGFSTNNFLIVQKIPSPFKKIAAQKFSPALRFTVLKQHISSIWNKCYLKDIHAKQFMRKLRYINMKNSTHKSLCSHWMKSCKRVAFCEPLRLYYIFKMVLLWTQKHCVACVCLLILTTYMLFWSCSGCQGSSHNPSTHRIMIKWKKNRFFKLSTSAPPLLFKHLQFTNPASSDTVES